MTVRCCFHMKSCCTVVLICLNLLWLLKLTLRENYPDYRVELLGLNDKQPFQEVEGEMYLRKIETNFKMANFELIEMMNETTPNEISEDAVLVVSASHSGVDNSYAHYLQKIQTSNEGSARLPFYLLRKTRSILLQNLHEIKSQTTEIAKVLEYLSNSLLVKKLTILSFEEGSLLVLKALTVIPYSTFSIFHKLILINPFNPSIMIYHSHAASFLQQVKDKILADENRTQLVNSTRIILINTITTDMGEGELNWLFENEQGERVTFANSLVVSSRFMWNVFCFLKPSEYFKFEPFLWILTKVFNEDRANGPLDIHTIRNILLYRELSTVRYLPMLTRNKVIPKCVEFQLENYSYDENIFNAQCIKLMRKQNYFFTENTTILLISVGRFELYGENFEKLSPFDSKNKGMVYLMENVLDYRRFFIVNRRRYNIHMTVHSISRPNNLKESWINDSIEELSTLDPDFVNKGFVEAKAEPIMLCPGFTLIYPLHFVSLYRPFSSQLTLELKNFEMGCYPGNDYFLDWIHDLVKRWSLGLNLMIFTLFTSHTLKKSTFSRFYYQLLTNFLLTLAHTGESLLTENLLVLAIVVVFQTFLKFIALLAEMISMPKSFASKIMLIPIVFYAIKEYDSSIPISPWKVIGVEFLAGTHKNNVIILFLEFGFIIEYIGRDIPNLTGLFLICIWLTVTACEEEQQQREKEEESKIIQEDKVNNVTVIKIGRKIKSLKSTFVRLRREFVDNLTTCIIAACLSEDGIVLHYIIDFYIVTYALIAAQQWWSDFN